MSIRESKKVLTYAGIKYSDIISASEKRKALALIAEFKRRYKTVYLHQ